MSDNYEFFISSDLNEYIEEWVAIYNNRVISHNKDLKKVYQEAKKLLNGKRPFISKVHKATAKLL